MIWLNLLQQTFAFFVLACRYENLSVLQKDKLRL